MLFGQMCFKTFLGLEKMTGKNLSFMGGETFSGIGRLKILFYLDIQHIIPLFPVQKWTLRGCFFPPMILSYSGLPQRVARLKYI